LNILNVQAAIKTNREVKAQMQNLNKLQYNYDIHCSYDNCYKIKQAACTFELVCKHNELNHDIFPKL